MRYVPQLDGLRAIAILAVLVTHFWAYPKGHELLNHLAAFGWVGVDLFFVLSGYLITGILRDTRDDPHHYRNFYARRALRIFPLYYLLLVLVLVALPLVKPMHPVENSWMFWIYAGNIALAEAGWQLFLLDITWSLSLEEQFYLIWPAAIRRLSNKRVMQVCLAVIIAMPILRWLLWEPLGWMWLHMVLRADGFAVGALIAVAMREGINVRRFGALIVIGIGIFWLVLTGSFARNSMLVGTIGYSATALMCGAGLILALNAKWLTSKVMVHIGRVSYGVYIYHPLCLAAVSLILAKQTGLLGSLMQLVVVSAVAVAVATVSHRVYETPFLRLKRWFEPAVNRSAHLTEAQRKVA